MKSLLCSVFLLVALQTTYAQKSYDSLTAKAKARIDSMGAKNLQSKLDKFGNKISTDSIKPLDSLNHRFDAWHGKLDSIKKLGNVERLRDSLKILTWSDSLRLKVNSSFAKSQEAVYGKMDSLTRLQLPTESLRLKADSLRAKQQSLLSEIKNKQSQLQQKVNTRYQKWGHKIDSLGFKAPAANVGNLTDKVKLPNATLPSGATNINAQAPTIPNAKLPVVPNAQLPNGTLPSTQMPGLNASDFKGLNLSSDLKNLGGKMSLPSADELKKWNSELKNLSNPMAGVKDKLGEVNSTLKDTGKAAENAAKELKDISAAGKELSNADKLLKENEAMKTANAMKDPEKLKEEAAKKAVDHFAGKEQVLKQAMDQMAKYKKKLPSLESLDKLPKRLWWPRNGLKGKPFRERVRFGLNLGIQNKRDTLSINLFPNASYNLTGRLELGLGFNYKLKWSNQKSTLDQSNPAWGINMFGTFKTYKSVRLRLEADAFNVARPGAAGEPLQRNWQWTWLLGFQTSYKISQYITGNVQMLYNFEKPITTSFPEQLVLRFGIQASLNKNKKKSEKPN